MQPSPTMSATLLLITYTAWIINAAAVGNPSSGSYLTESGLQGSYRFPKAFSGSSNSQRETSGSSSQQAGGSGGSGSSNNNAAAAVVAAAANAAAAAANSRPSEHVVVLNDGSASGQDNRLTSGQLRPPYTILYQDGLKVTVVDRTSTPGQQLFPQDLGRPFHPLAFNQQPAWPWGQTSFIPATASTNFIPPWYSNPLVGYSRPQQSPFEQQQQQQQQQQLVLQQAASLLPLGSNYATANPFLPAAGSTSAGTPNFAQNQLAAAAAFGLQQPGPFPTAGFAPGFSGISGGGIPPWLPQVPASQAAYNVPTAAYSPYQTGYYPSSYPMSSHFSTPANFFLPQSPGSSSGINPAALLASLLGPGFGSSQIGFGAPSGSGYNPNAGALLSGYVGSQQEGSEPTISPASETGIRDISAHLNNFIYPSSPQHQSPFRSSLPLYQSSAGLPGQWTPSTRYTTNLPGGSFTNQQLMDYSNDHQQPNGPYSGSTSSYGTWPFLQQGQIMLPSTSGPYYSGSRLPIMGEFSNSGGYGSTYYRGNGKHLWSPKRK